MKQATFGLLVIAVVCGMSGCKSTVAYRGKLVQEIPSPGGAVTAIVTKADGSAVTPPVIRVYFRVAQTDRLHKMLLADMTKDMKIFWQDQNNLVINLPCAHIEEFRNFIELTNSRKDYVRTVAIKLTNGGVCMKAFGYQR